MSGLEGGEIGKPIFSTPITFLRTKCLPQCAAVADKSHGDTHHRMPRHYIRIINQLRFLSMRARLYGTTGELPASNTGEQNRIVLFVVLRAMMEVSDSPGELLSLLHIEKANTGSGLHILDHLQDHGTVKDEKESKMVEKILCDVRTKHLEKNLPELSLSCNHDIEIFRILMAGVTLR